VLTIFTVPKPFEGHVGVIQDNALASWVRIGAEVVLLGDEKGVGAAAARHRARHEPALERTPLGTPRVDDLFRRARSLAHARTLCFANADILLPTTLAPAVSRVADRFDRFVALGRCRDLDVLEPLDGTDWAALARENGTLRPAGGIDYLVFTRDLYDTMPPFALGRAGFDNWLVWDARRRRVPVVDLTPSVTAVHQNHDYGHIVGGRAHAYDGAEAKTNIALAGGELHLYNVDDATHRLEAGRLVRNPLAPVRRVPPARWLALRLGELRRALAAHRPPLAS